MPKHLRMLVGVMFMGILSFVTVAGAQTMQNREMLSKKQQGLIPIAAFTANGHGKALRVALHEGLDAGLSVNEIKEVLVQLYAYAGFPRSLNAISAFMDVLKEREAKGIQDELGREATPLPAGTNRLKLGTEVQTRLVGAPVKGGAMDFAPAIDAFLKEHLFGDIFGRDNLDFQNRELVTIAALAAMEGVNPQLQSHFTMGLNTGLTQAQMRDLIAVLARTVDEAKAQNAREVLGKVQ